jgi:hypothetical protein
MGPSTNWWIAYSALILVVGIVLVVVTGGRWGVILVAGGAVGVAVRVWRLGR